MSWLGLVTLAWGGIMLFRAMPVGGEWLPISVRAWTAALGWLVAYAMGFTLYLHTAKPRAATVDDISIAWTLRWIRILCWIAIVGAGLIVVEFAILRGYGFSTPVALIRLAEVEGAVAGAFGGSAVSGAGRLMTPALQIVWILAVMRWRHLSMSVKSLLLFATLAVLLQQAMYEGGRFFLATLVVGGLIARTMNARATRTRVRAFASPRTLIIAGAAVLAFGFVFLDRANSLELDLSTAYLVYTRGFSVAVEPEVIARLDGAGGPLWFVASMFWMYITQGPSELAVLLDQQGFVHAYGLFQFQQIGLLLSKISGAALTYDVFSYLENAGVYATFVGAAYIDFGMGGAFLSAAVLGAITAAAIRAVESGRMNALGLSAPLLVVLGLFSPIISLVTNVWPAIVWAIFVGATSTRRASQPAGGKERWRTI